MTGESQEPFWPVPKFHFKATIGDKGAIAFQEVLGLDTDYDSIEYRHANKIELSTVKMPGLRKSSDVTLKKGMFRYDPALFNYFAGVQMNTMAKLTVTIQLLDEEHKPMFTWTLKNAFPIKVSGTNLNAQNSEVVVEEIVLAHEGLSFEKA